jgi:hypothetical protein
MREHTAGGHESNSDWIRDRDSDRIAVSDRVGATVGLAVIGPGERVPR